MGVAPEATLIAYKILDQNGNGYISDAIAALQDCIAKEGQVTNSSFGTQSNPGSLVQAAYDNAETAGLVNVAAAGNASFRRCKKIAYPARYGSVIAVTATDPNNQIASFSCRGSQAELAAPGVAINSTVPLGPCGLCSASNYLLLSGTSMASPHVAGVAALVIASGITDDNFNGRINDEVRQRLQQTADNLGSANNYGYGLVDADEAAASSVPPAPPLAPSGLMATAVSSSQIDLSWSDNSDNESGFEIERCDGFSVEITSVREEENGLLVEYRGRVFLGARPTDGFSVEITSVREEENGLLVEYRGRRPDPAALVGQIVTSPFHPIQPPWSDRS